MNKNLHVAGLAIAVGGVALQAFWNDAFDQFGIILTLVLAALGIVLVARSL